MIERVEWLALEVKYLDEAREFYEGVLGLEASDVSEREARYPLPSDAELVLRAPGAVPRGGVHVHYALSAPEHEIPRWRERLDSEGLWTQTEEFGGATSLYFYDVDGHCVELAGVADGDAAVEGFYEVVLEVEDLDAYVADLVSRGAEEVDCESDRVRLNAGAIDIEVWRPRLGLADGQGGVHVDLGVVCEGRPPDDAVEVERGYRRRDEEGHH
ncbi:MAG: VOC family protein, partial [Halobacteriales archaeon]